MVAPAAAFRLLTRRKRVAPRRRQRDVVVLAVLPVGPMADSGRGRRGRAVVVRGRVAAGRPGKVRRVGPAAALQELPRGFGGRARTRGAAPVRPSASAASGRPRFDASHCKTGRSSPWAA